VSDSIVDIFRDEAREHLAEMEKLFLDLEMMTDDAGRRALINALFRHAHSLKGDAKVVGLEALKTVVQTLEDQLDGLRKSPTDARPETVSRGLAQLDLVRREFLIWESKLAAASSASRPIADSTAAPQAPGVPQGVLPRDAVTDEARGDDAFRVRVSSEQLDQMLNLAGELRISRRSMAAVANRLMELRNHLAAQLKSVGRLSTNENRQHLEASLDLLRRIDDDLHKKVAREDLLGETLDAHIRQARLLPLSMLTDSLRRAVRDLSGSLKKEIRLEVDGDVMLDKAVLGMLRDPLLHLLRNAADHGIESGEERVVAGKPAGAVIRISASLQGSMARICVADDGRGIDFESVRQEVRRRGDFKERESDELGQRELAGYLFLPGFSTAAAGEISGRGVGLDVVSDTVRRLQGTVELESSSPAGSVFAITVPTIISSIRILTVVAGGRHFGVPLSAVRRTGQARPDELRELEGRPVLPHEGRSLRWAYLSELVGPGEPLKHRQDAARPYFIAKQQEGEIAVVVDDIEDESEVLLKPLGFPIEGLPGILGAAIRPDGAVQLVLDLTGTTWTRPTSRLAPMQSESRAAGRVLVVDDSPTTRAILRNMLTIAGFIVITAKDGVEALELLRSRSVDLVVSDVDMPRLNGFDLTRHVKTKLGLPVILVTGREKDEHRREGLAAGADAYVVKSTFEDKGLLDVVRQFI
jgi:two-component system chemotaxis sensor kinase CheA